ncbi:hypothetical protein PRIPAC_75767 [Pristionchus pacificus]|uniref:Uncharacterized protein n=1 Tax=Pristionchus pacificus TaxID=54126 RepID=A0A454Y356_PRIPA|nr:hypothetical protein PRIPAC_75767 [Pristionchus pacificus]|eukprot:PDM83888.1 hypothetical protein PRIPAC_30375 [Pristionchus pacificus]
MRLLPLLFIIPLVSLAREIPEFDDELLGRLVISKKRFPFLTPKDAPELAHVYPTDQQLNMIKAAIGAPEYAMRMKRSLGDGDEDGFPSDPTAAFGWFNDFKKFLGQFLKFEFSYEVLNSTVIDPGSLPFDKIKSDAFFKAMVIDKAQFQPYLDQEFNNRMRTTAASEKSWLPAEKLIQEMRECLYFKYGSASDEDFQYDKDTGGTMVYYKVTCMLVKDSYYIGLSTYDNNFLLHDIEHVDTIQSGWSFLGMSKQKTKIERWFEKRYITLNDLKQLLDFIMRDFAERIRMEYRQYLEAANIPVPS